MNGAARIKNKINQLASNAQQVQQQSNVPITQNIYGYNGANDYDLGQTLMSWAGLGNDARAAAYNEMMTRLQMEREDTAYQRAVADMRAAGLNPAMMYAGSGSSGLPANAGANENSSSGNGLTNILNGINDLLTTAASLAVTKKPITNIEKHNHYNNIFK